MATTPGPTQAILTVVTDQPEQVLRRLAHELGERASVVFGFGPSGEAWVRFTPRNSEAAPMTVRYSTTDDEAEPLLDVADFVAAPGDLDDVIQLGGYPSDWTTLRPHGSVPAEGGPALSPLGG
jgi:hypothetical protein